jgi:hypothetical protein|tara:strand:+ start:732 stop:932 length:201 start_codon:yes stop_codon:yes gene_type:complete
MNLYKIQDSDRDMWVVAKSMGHAVESWREVIFKENPDEYKGVEDVEEPSGVVSVCTERELFVNTRP